MANFNMVAQSETHNDGKERESGTPGKTFRESIGFGNLSKEEMVKRRPAGFEKGRFQGYSAPRMERSKMGSYNPNLRNNQNSTWATLSQTPFGTNSTTQNRRRDRGRPPITRNSDRKTIVPGRPPDGFLDDLRRTRQLFKGSAGPTKPLTPKIPVMQRTPVYLPEFRTPVNNISDRYEEADLSANSTSGSSSYSPDSDAVVSEADLDKQKEIEHLLKLAMDQLDDVHRIQDAHKAMREATPGNWIEPAVNVAPDQRILEISKIRKNQEFQAEASRQWWLSRALQRVERAERDDQDVRDVELYAGDYVPPTPPTPPIPPLLPPSTVQIVPPTPPGGPPLGGRVEDMSIKKFNEARPDITRCERMIKLIEKRNLKIQDKYQWAALVAHFKELEAAERWPRHLMDLNAVEWDPLAPESALDAKLRTEMYTVLSSSVDWAKHKSKMEKVSDADMKFNAQALFRRLNDFFAVGKTDGDVNGAGVKLRESSMAKDKVNLVEYGLRILKREKVLNQMGLNTNVRLELIPLYLRGLLKSFDPFRLQIEIEMERDQEDGKPDWPLLKVMSYMEGKSIKYNLQNLVSTGTIKQNVQGKKGKKGGKGKNNNTDKQITALQQTVNELNQKMLSQNSSTAKGGKKCQHQEKCWRKDCKLEHKVGHKPAVNPYDTVCDTCNKKGHKTEQCGKCFRCGSADHRISDCKAPKVVSQNVQVAKVEEVNAEEEDSDCMLRM